MLWVLSSTQYKYTTFFAEIQIALTFRNTLRNVKMQRFAAATGGCVLYYEARSLRSLVSTQPAAASSTNSSISRNYSGGLSMTSFFNTNLSNLSNFAERLPEGTIRFVLCTNLANDSNAMRTANLVSIRVIRGGKN